MLAQEEEYHSLAEFMFEGDDDVAPNARAAPDLADDDDDLCDEDADRFAREIAAANRNDPDQRPPRPVVIVGDDGVATWHRSTTIGDVTRITPIPLKAAQYDHYCRLQHAGEKQLLTFLSGQVRSSSHPPPRSLPAHFFPRYSACQVPRRVASASRRSSSCSCRSGARVGCASS